MLCLRSRREFPAFNGAAVLAEPAAGPLTVRARARYALFRLDRATRHEQKKKRDLMHSYKRIAVMLATTVVSSIVLAGQVPAIHGLDEKVLREYTGAYSWSANQFLYLQLWDEFTGFGKPRELVAFDESGVVRTLYPTERDEFFAGPGMAVSSSVESRITFERDDSGSITALKWQQNGNVRIARPVTTEKHEAVQFSSRNSVRLAGTLFSPTASGKHSAIILVHGSGAENREYMLPWARFLVRQGIAVLGYDKRGVGDRRVTGTQHQSKISRMTCWRHSSI